MHNIVLIQSCWHKNIVDQFKSGFSQHIEELLPRQTNLSYLEAPGVVEIPLLVKLCAKRGEYAAIVVTGLIVDHKIYRHEFVAQSVMDAIMRIQVDTEVPVIYGILTAQDFVSEGREAFFLKHFVIKGREAAVACHKTLTNIAGLSVA